jgi:transmembrane sensor
MNAQILEEAAAWFIDLTESDANPATRNGFNTWLRRSPEHVRAYLSVSAFWEDADQLGTAATDLDTLIARARAGQNVYALERDTRVVEPAARSGSAAQVRSARKRLLAFAASLLLVSGASFLGWYAYSQHNTYATQIGEQRSITLEDGSLVELNSLSRVRVHFAGHERGVELLQGQALFKVAKDAARPFVVRSSGMSVRAVGTQFDVYRKRSGTVVTVVEGRVAVKAAVPDRGVPAASGQSPSPGPALIPVLVAAGEQLVVTPTAMSRPTRANVSQATAWTEKKLVFESTPLREVVEEFNRYNRQQLVILDPELDSYHISGVFPSTDSSRMVEFLRQRFGVTLSRSGDELEISRRPATSAPTTT